MRAAILIAALVLSGCIHDTEVNVSGEVEITGLDEISAAIESLRNSAIRVDVLLTVKNRADCSVACAD